MPQTINLGGAFTLGSLYIGDSVAPYRPFTIGPTAILYLNVTAGSTLIEKSGEGADVFAPPITLYDPLIIVTKQNNTTQSLRFDGAIGQSGTQSITVNGAGEDSTVEFANANSYSGGLILNSGRVRASRATLALGNGVLTLNGGIIELADNNPLSLSRPTTVNSNAAFIINRMTDGPWTRYTMGTLSIGNQKLSVASGSKVKGVGGERGWEELFFGATTIREDGAIFDVGPTTHLTLGALSGDYAITKQGSGRLELATAATRASGSTTLSSGTLRLRTANALSTVTTDPLYLNRGILALMGGGTAFKGSALTVGGNTAIEVGPASIGNGVTHTLTSLSIGDNTLSVRKNEYVASYPGGTAGIFGLTIGPTTLTGSSVFDVSDAAPTASTVNPTYPLGVLTLGAVGGSGGFTKTGSGALTLATAGNFTGPVVISQGTVKLGNATGLGTTAGDTTVMPGGMLDVTAAITVTEPLNLSGTGLNNWGALVNKSASAATFSGSVTLDGGVRIGPYAAGAITLSGPITGPNVAFEKVGYGAGAVVFAGANTFTGTTTVTAGKLQLGYATQNNSKLNDASNLILAGGNLDLAGGSHVEVVAGTVLTAGESYVSRASGTGTLEMNAISRAPGSMLNIQADNITTTDNRNENGVLGGWATIGSGWAINSTDTNDGPITALATYTTTDEATWTSNDNVNVTTAQILTADRQVNSLFLGGSAAHDIGADQILRIQNGGLLVGGVYNVSFLNGTLTAGVDDDTPGELIVSHNGTVANTLVIGSVIADNGSGSVSLSKNRAGTLQLDGANTYSGDTYLNAGKLILNNNNALGASTLRIRQATTLDSTVGGITLAGNPQIWDGDFTFSGTASLNLGAGPVSLGTIPAGTAPYATRVITFASTAAGKTLTLGGPISGNFGLTKAGAFGILALGGANTYAGDTIHASDAVAAPIRLIASDVIPNGFGKGNVFLNGNNTLLDMNGFDDTINGLINNGTAFVDNLAPGTTSTLTIGDNNYSGWFSGVFRNTAAGGSTLNIAKTGSGVLYLAGVNLHSGTTTIDGGTLRMGNAAALGSSDGATVVNAGGALDLNGLTITALEPFTFNGGVLTNFSATAATLPGPVTVSDDSIANVGLTGIVLNGNLGGSGNLTKQGVGYLYLNGDNSAFDGELIIDAGLVKIKTAGTTSLNGLGSALGGTIVRAGAVLDVFGQSIGDEPLSLSGFGNNYIGALYNSGAADVTLSGPITLADDAGINSANSPRIMTFSGKVGGSSGFEKLGSGVLILDNAANNYAGDTLVRVGVVRLGAADVIPDGAGKGNLNLIGTLDLNGFSETVNGLNGQGGVTATTGSPILTVGANNASSAYYGAYVKGTGDPGLTKIGSGTLTLAGGSSFTGPMRIEDGIVRATISTGSLGGKGQLELAGGDLEIANNANLSPTKNSVVVSGNTRITIDRLSTAGAGIASALGTLSIGNQTVDVAGGGLVTNGTAALTFGATTLSGSPTFTVTDPANGGGTRLTLGAIGGAGDLTIKNYAMSDNGVTLAGVQSQSGDLVLINYGSSANGIAVSGAQNFTGDLILQNNGTGADGIIVSGAPNHSGRIINSGTGTGRTLISGSIGPNVTEVIQASEASVLVLSGANTFTAGLAVESNRTVRIANAAGSATGTGDVNINAGGTLDGSGFIDGTVILNAGGTLSPSINDRTVGSSMTLGSLEWHGGGVLDCVVTKLEGANGGTDYGQIVVQGNINALPGDTNLIIRLDTLRQTFAVDPNLNYGFNLIQFATEGMATNISLASIQLDTNAFLVAGGSWSLTNLYNSIYYVCLSDTPPAMDANIWIAPGYVQTGTSGNLDWDYWARPNNWSLGHVPAPGEDVVFDFISTRECRMNEITNSIGSLTLTPGYGNKLVFWTGFPGEGFYSNVLVTGDVTVESGNLAHLDHNDGADVAVNRLVLTVGGDFKLGASATIDLDGLGYRATYGPGAGNNLATTASRSASHGGAGANNLDGKTTYGSITQPESLGSGAAGPGGGALFLKVDGTATIDGLISSRGIGGTATTCAGAGGSIFIQAAHVAGSGTLRAGANTDLPVYTGSGGGRIAVIATSGGTLGSLNISANTHPTALNGGGRAGTVYLETTAFKRLVIDQQNIGTASDNYTELPAPTETFDTIQALGGPLEDVTLIMTNNAFVKLNDDLRMGDLPRLSGQLALNSYTLYLKAPAPAGTFPGDYGAGLVTFPGLFTTFANGDSLTRDGRLLWGNPGATWLVLALAYNDGQQGVGIATNKGYVNESYIAHGSSLEFEAIPDYLTFRFWDGTIPDGTASSPNNPLLVTNLTGRAAFRAWFADPFVNDTYLEWLPSAGSDDWFAPYNWNLLMIPIAGQHVTIPAGSSVRINALTPVVASLTVDEGATVTFDGWNSALQATTINVNGTITHLPQTVTAPNKLGEWVPQHRIWIKGQNLTVAASGMLNADGKGYKPGAGPGAAPAQGGHGNDGTGYNAGGGGGYGGPGAACRSQRRGEAYGVPNDPWQPGSGGGYRPNYYGMNARPAGGAIRVEMTDSVTINGLVTASGPNATAHGTAGSGGGIAIYCQTFTGATSGWVRADGGTGYPTGGSGGGGRIALYYNPASQAELPNPRPPVHISAAAGLVVNPAASETMVLPVMGSLYMPDTTLLAASPAGPVVLDDHRFWYTRLYIGSQPSSWSPASLTIENCLVGFPENYTLHVGGNLTLAGSQEPLSGDDRAGLHLFATNSVNLYGSQLRVGGNFVIGENTWFYPHTDGHSPAIVGTRVGSSFTVAAGGGVNADMDGYIVAEGNGPRADESFSVAGGSYGGWGGVVNPKNGETNCVARPPYGDAAVPLDAGSPGEWNEYGNYCAAGRGGGVIHILAGSRMTINGTLTANGGKGVYYNGSGGSGGSILLACSHLKGGGALQARGGTITQSQAHPGGGGRIAVWQNLPLAVADERVANRNVAKLTKDEALRGFSGVIDVQPGAPDGHGATAGTIEFYSLSVNLFILR